MNADRTVAPGSLPEAAEALRATDAAGGSVRFAGGGTKRAWGRPGTETSGVLVTSRLNRIVEHNAADLTLIAEAGTRLSEIEGAVRAAGQILAIDPPDPTALATIGGVLATGDSGPLRQRYGGPRDLVLGMRVALADGTVARSGGKVIKNVAGYDLAKLFTGSFGSLGLIGEVVLRLHPAPPARATVVGRSSDPERLGRAAVAVGSEPLELEAFDVRWSGGEGTLLARVGGRQAGDRARRAAAAIAAAALDAKVIEEVEAEEGVWRTQREGQRAATGGVAVRVSGLRTDVRAAIEAARATGASLVGRASLGLFWFRLPPSPVEDLRAAIGEIRSRLRRPVAVLDAPEPLRHNPWGPVDDGLARLMRSVRERFDPNRTCNPGVFLEVV